VEFEFQSFLKLDEDHVRANYGMVKLHLEKGEEEEVKMFLDKLTSIDALSEKEEFPEVQKLAHILRAKLEKRAAT